MLDNWIWCEFSTRNIRGRSSFFLKLWGVDGEMWHLNGTWVVIKGNQKVKILHHWKKGVWARVATLDSSQIRPSGWCSAWEYWSLIDQISWVDPWFVVRRLSICKSIQPDSGPGIWYTWGGYIPIMTRVEIWMNLNFYDPEIWVSACTQAFTTWKCCFYRIIIENRSRNEIHGLLWTKRAVLVSPVLGDFVPCIMFLPCLK